MAKQIIGAGCTDLPAMEDKFKIEKYVGGLTTFICNCNTPMTMAIQGDWGTGKTSVMQMIRKQLKEEPNIHDIWFNTWQFSQFDMGDKLPLMLMSKLLKSVGGKEKIKVKEAGEKILGVIGDIVIGTLSGGSANADSLRRTEVKITDFVDKIEEIKDNFQELINEEAGENGRVVIFVDDLDRLQPGKAVELLEILKIFLDCEKCIFVLAIDYGVVCRGVKEKYGDDFSEEKGKSFFDKIIQVPFKMPVADYDIQSYVKSNFEQIGVTVKDDNQLKIFVELIERSIGNNPRSMKRLFNSFLLLKSVADSDIISDTHNEEILFALLCMQSKYEKIYNYFMRNKEEIDTKFLLDLVDEGNAIFDNLKINGDEQCDFINFAEIFNSVIDKDQKNGIDNNELAALRKVLDFSAITATDTVSTFLRGSKQANDLEALKMQYKNLKEKQYIYEFVKSIDPNIHIQLINNNSGVGHIVGRLYEGGPKVCDIAGRNKGFSVDCIVPKASCYTDAEEYPEIVNLISELGVTPGKYMGGRAVSVTFKDVETEEKVKSLLKICYKLFLE